jgi:uncharacterized heparinase superfamily protein
MTAPERLLRDLQYALADIRLELAHTRQEHVVDDVLAEYGYRITNAASNPELAAKRHHPAGKHLETR